MSLHQLRYFVTVAEEGTLRAASERLHVAQPPLSRHIRALEEELGVELFERRPRGMRLLPAGRRFLAEVRTVLAALDHAVVSVRQPP